MQIINNIKIGFIIALLYCLLPSCTHNSSEHNDSVNGMEDKVDLLTPGNLIHCDTFLLNTGVSEFRVGLYNYFPEEYLKNREVIIIEKTWEHDSISNKTVWYILDKGELHPVDSRIWLKETEF